MIYLSQIEALRTHNDQSEAADEYEVDFLMGDLAFFIAQKMLMEAGARLQRNILSKHGKSANLLDGPISESANLPDSGNVHCILRPDFARLREDKPYLLGMINEMMDIYPDNMQLIKLLTDADGDTKKLVAITAKYLHAVEENAWALQKAVAYYEKKV